MSKKWVEIITGALVAAIISLGFWIWALTEIADRILPGMGYK